MKLLTVLTVAFGFAISPAQAAEPGKRPKGVVELFTSQGCNSCPPADEYLSQLALEGDVVALSYHVDYWDYLGWRDTLATSDNTQRQHQYSRAFGTRSVYTPQAIINGRQEVNGAKRTLVDNAINEMADTIDGMIVDVDVSYSGDTLVVETSGVEGWSGDAHVVLVYFDRATDVKIERGKNSGRRFTYLNSVNAFHTAGKWHGKATRLELPMSEISRKAPGGCAVLIQSMKQGGLPGAVLGAAIVPREESW
ncbi:DUF1223 domain-containing protein [Aquamicrobium zhengzhouense]|uniref:DUF1223 domain-containing protein n=1 Tax=Aquamicrobium zhengzhouense TaxID=2781738 RepID=A0ABS0SE22_9HYPH|nr:DUF1223 domain-containing protein [Aquamicrobium zhengzhouense]MBI1620890.1 DUF1223 domain-containing protein [Aquamicrobium zhengzhouense]